MRQETDEMKFIGRQSAGSERGDQGTRAGDRLDPEACGNGRLDDPFARIADARCAGISDQRDLLTAPESFEDFLSAFGFVELKIAEQWFGDVKMFQQPAAMPRVFRSDHIAFAQNPQRARGDVLEIADGCRDEIQGGSMASVNQN